MVRLNIFFVFDFYNDIVVLSSSGFRLKSTQTLMAELFTFLFHWNFSYFNSYNVLYIMYNIVILSSSSFNFNHKHFIAHLKMSAI